MIRQRGSMLMGALCFMFIPAIALSMTADPAAEAQIPCFEQSSRASEIPEAVLPLLIQSIAEEMPASYHVRPGSDGKLLAHSPAQQLAFAFSDRGLEVSAGKENSWGMRLVSYAFDQRALDLEAVSPEGQGARVELMCDRMATA
jgi:hypothetical protein